MICISGDLRLDFRLNIEEIILKRLKISSHFEVNARAETKNHQKYREKYSEIAKN